MYLNSKFGVEENLNVVNSSALLVVGFCLYFCWLEIVLEKCRK
jgi:hypothetical protein